MLSLIPLKIKSTQFKIKLFFLLKVPQPSFLLADSYLIMNRSIYRYNDMVENIDFGAHTPWICTLAGSLFASSMPSPNFRFFICMLKWYKHGRLAVLLCILRGAIAFCGINLRNVGTIQQANAQ